ncbi:SRPBCC family protein [Clostridium omnivorum]|uniref:ATPase n=1 Tax=Clostridium omnivorum TaxID=1604902 RepID=A0ABQ5N507_9CLOT|nr:SRPBCC family protein [Clostridium sp. E14]GLC30314.1 ATPase [Clostridium sp. E14]
MPKQLVVKKEIEINADISKVWNALINPKLIKQYLFGTEAISEWNIGSPIIFRGKWEGKTYEDKGLILKLITNKIFQYAFWSPLSGLEDKSENYANITYELIKKGEDTLLTINQDNIITDEMFNRVYQNWEIILKGLKETVEKNANSH